MLRRLGGPGADRYAPPAKHPYQAYRTEDGYVTAGGNDERLGRTFCQAVLERPDLLEDPRYAHLPSRMTHVDELEADIEAVLPGRTTAKWVERLDAARVSGGPVPIYDRTLEDEHVLARGVVRGTEHPVIRPMRILGSPIAPTTPPTFRSPALRFGQHADDALHELGLDDAAIGQLHADGVVYDQQRAKETDR